MKALFSNCKALSSREVFIGFFIGSLVLFFIMSLFIEKSYFPFVKFKMFDRVVRNPVSTVFYISAVDSNNKETMIKKNLMGPMSLREVAALLNLGDEKAKSTVTDILFKRAQGSFDDFHKFRLYEYSCDCLNYYRKPEGKDFLEYIDTSCTKKMLLEKTNE